MKFDWTDFETGSGCFKSDFYLRVNKPQRGKYFEVTITYDGSPLFKDKVTYLTLNGAKSSAEISFQKIWQDYKKEIEYE